MVCHLEASVGSTAPVKERRVLNDPKRLLGADFQQTSVPRIFDVIVRTAFFFLWAPVWWTLLPHEGSPDVAPNPIFMQFASNGDILVGKK